MANKTVKLKYAASGLGLYSKLHAMKDIIKWEKQKDSIQEFGEADDFEIGRGQSYALFPELKDMVAGGQQINVEAFRNSLAQRRVKDIAFQNKILNFTLQNKSGLLFGVGRIIENLFFENDYLIFMDNESRELEMKVNNDKSVSLIFKATWQKHDPTGETPSVPGFKTEVKLNIKPNKITVSKFNLTKITDNDEVIDSAYNFLIANQQSILMKIITFIKHALGFKGDFRIEKTKKDDVSWVAPSM